jgi:tetratricopeptide (TPR) repeat protein
MDEFNPSGMDELGLSNFLLAILSLPTDNPDRAHNLNVFGAILQNRYRESGTLEDINRTITFEEHILQAAEDWKVQRAAHYNRLSVAYISRFPISRSRADLDDAIQAAERSTQIPEEDGAVRMSRLNTLGVALNLRYTSFGTSADLERAIKVSKEANQLIPDSDPNMGLAYNNLSCFQLELFRATNQVVDLEEAIESAKTAIRCTEDSHPEKSGRLNTLAVVFQLRFQRCGSLDDLNYAIKNFDEALKMASQNPRLAVGLQVNLGGALLDRFELSGSVVDLKEAIINLTAALDKLPSNHIDRPACLSNRCQALVRRFDREGSLDDLVDAVKNGHEALESTPNHDLHYVARVNNVAMALQLLSINLKSTAELDEAISMVEHAIENIAESHRYYVTLLQNLGNHLNQRYFLSANRTKDQHFLTDAIVKLRLALKHCPKDDPRAMMIHNNIGNVLKTRFQETRSKEDLESAIDELKSVVRMCPKNHANRAMILHNAGNALKERYDLTRLTEHLKEAIDMYVEGALIEFAPPTWRILCARYAAALLYPDSLELAANLMEKAIYLLRKVCPRTLEREDQQHQLLQFGGLASDASALSLKASGDPETALQLLELGRGVMANLLLEQRRNLGSLNMAPPNLAQRFYDVVNRLDPTTRDLVTPRIEASQEAENNSNQPRRELSNEFDEVVELIHQVPGFEHFLNGLSVDELRNCALDHSAVVVINVSRYGSDAIIVASKRIKRLELPNLTYDGVNERVKAIARDLDVHRNASQRDAIPVLHSNQEAKMGLEVVLNWLWENGVAAIMADLGYTATPENAESWPRIWWILVGPLCLLPIHSAGPKPGVCVMDRAISSYAPTIQALFHARTRMDAMSTERLDKVGFVCMPTTPGQKTLDFAAAEVKAVETILSPTSIKFETPKTPTKKDVLRLLRECNIIHFACHGHISDDPSKSLFMLSDWKTNPFTVADLVQMNLRKTNFAYLAACHTASSQTQALLDEAIHMAGTCLLAGIPAVIGTLWEIEDRQASEVAEKVYTAMKTGNTGLDVIRAAECLHFALREVREIMSSPLEDQPFIWASFVHFGV